MPQKPNGGKVVSLHADSRQAARKRLLEQLFEEHGHALRVFLKARIWRRDDIDDLVQELFLKLADRDDLETCISPQSGSNRGFLLTCAINLIVDRQRKRKRRQRLDDQHQAMEPGATNVTPEQIMESSQELQRIMDAIHALRPNWRKAFVLNRFHHLSYPEIAVAMGVSTKQIQKFMSKALQRLREVAAQIENEAGAAHSLGGDGDE